MKFIISTVLMVLFTNAFQAQDTIKKATELEEVVIKKEKKAIEKRADRTIFDFSSQAQLNSGSVLEGLRKLPGLIISDVAGLMYQGAQLDVFMDTRPLNISSNELNAFLEGMPANAIEKVEIITQPGAEFPATSGGAIINIVTSKTAKNYLSATYNNGANITSYDKNRMRFNNSVILNAKNKFFGWQLNVGQNYRESALWSNVSSLQNGKITTLSNTDADRISRTEYVRSAITFDLKKDRLLLNYDINYNNSNANTVGSGLGFVTDDASKTKSFRQEAVATYQKRFDDADKKLDVVFNFVRGLNTFGLDSRLASATILDNASDQKYFNFKVDYSQEVKLLKKGKFSAGILIDELQFDTQNFAITNLDYRRKTSAGYFEVQSSWQKFDFIVGSRAENYNIYGNTNNAALIPFNQFRIFPNASAQYNFAKDIFFGLNYNKKISLPSTSSLNPNNTNYQNPNVSFAGNPQLQPTIFDNYKVEISAFNYAFINYNLSVASNQVINRVLQNGNIVTNQNINLDQIRIHSFNVGLPIPYMLFTKGLAETMKFDFNPDKINFLYVYAGYQKHEIADVDKQGLWFFNLMSQILLPKDIKFVTQFNGSTTGGNYFYFIANRPFSQSLDVSFMKKFLNNNLTFSLNFDDILNTNIQALSSFGTTVNLENKYDTRRFGLTMNYKIPTKNKLAKENQNLLNKEKAEPEQMGM